MLMRIISTEMCLKMMIKTIITSVILMPCIACFIIFDFPIDAMREPGKHREHKA